MERLTQGDGVNYWSINGKNYNNAFARLAAIEYMLCGEDGKQYDLDRLRELVGADRDGRCMVLTEQQKKFVEVMNKEGLFGGK